MVMIGHYVPWIRANAYRVRLMMISGVAGLLYARDFAKGYAKGALGGAIAGGTCGVIGICAANILGDVPLIALPIGAAHHDAGRRHRRTVRPDGGQYPQAERIAHRATVLRPCKQGELSMGRFVHATDALMDYLSRVGAREAAAQVSLPRRDPEAADGDDADRAGAGRLPRAARQAHRRQDAMSRSAPSPATARCSVALAHAGGRQGGRARRQQGIHRPRARLLEGGRRRRTRSICASVPASTRSTR